MLQWGRPPGLRGTPSSRSCFQKESRPGRPDIFRRLRPSCRIEYISLEKPASAGVVAIYPGSFDPITNGHLDLIERGSRLFGTLIVSILRNETKAPLFTVDERVAMLREVVRAYP